MQNLLIIEDNLVQSHFLANSICKEIPNVRLYNIATTGMEAINIIKLDLKLPDMTGIDIINFIYKNDIIKYNSSIIIFTGEMDLLAKVVRNKYIYNYCSKTNGIDFILTQVKNLINEKQTINYIDSIRNKIKIELENLKFDFSYIGTKYLSECIYECYLKSNAYNFNLNKHIYPIISKKYNKTINSIKASIFQSTSIMYYEIDKDILSDYFGYNIINKPKPKDIISTILQRIQ